MEAIFRFWSRYKGAILSGVGVIAFYIATIWFFGELKSEIAAVVGLLITIPIRFFGESYMSPILIIKGEPEKRTMSRHKFHSGYLYFHRTNHGYTTIPSRLKERSPP